MVNLAECTSPEEVDAAMRRARKSVEPVRWIKNRVVDVQVTRAPEDRAGRRFLCVWPRSPSMVVSRGPTLFYVGTYCLRLYVYPPRRWFRRRKKHR